MSRSAQVHADVLYQRLIAIVRAGDREVALAKTRLILEAGVRAVEVTLTTPGAVEVIGELANRYPRARVGAGTVLDAAHASAAVAAGAQFLVSPHTAFDVIDYARSCDVACYPGAGSVSEIRAATRAGATAVKLFPASMFGSRFIRDIRAPLPDVALIPTGGVTLANAPEWIKAGAVAVGVGADLTDIPAAQINARVSALLTALAGTSAGADKDEV